MQAVSGIKHPAFQDAYALTRPGGRVQTGRYLVEGADLVHQALAGPSPVGNVFAVEDEAGRLYEACGRRNAPLYVASAGLLAKLVGTSYETAVTAVAVVGQRLLVVDDLLASPDALLLAGERIQDPRNVGVLVRTAEAAGCHALVLSSDSAEPFSRQAVRSTTGSILRLPLCLVPNLAEVLTQLRAHGARVVATSARAPKLAYDTDLIVRPLVLVVGNETAGMGEATRNTATDFVAFPMAPGGASSLNVTVAAGVLLYEAIRQRRTAVPLAS